MEQDLPLLLSQKIVEPYRPILHRLCGFSHDLYGDRLCGLLLFGSVGRGTPHYNSDLDLLLVIDPLPHGRMARVREFDPIEESLEPDLQQLRQIGRHCELSPIFKTCSELFEGSPLMFDMTVEGEILFEKDSILTSALDKLRSNLTRLGSQKVSSGGGWYWRLKPDYKPGEVFSL